MLRKEGYWVKQMRGRLDRGIREAKKKLQGKLAREELAERREGLQVSLLRIMMRIMRISAPAWCPLPVMSQHDFHCSLLPNCLRGGCMTEFIFSG